jgi:hypothetical protein
MGLPAEVKPNGPLHPGRSLPYVKLKQALPDSAPMPLPRLTYGRTAFAGLALGLMAALFAPSGSAEAACKCLCVDGKAQAVCSSSTDIRPFCQSSACPIVPPAKSPLDARQPAPEVRPGCETKQVYDPQTRAYSWDQVCK